MFKFLEHITPDEYVSSIHDVDMDRLWALGKRLILSDLDNTLVPWNNPEAPESLVRWFLQAQRRGFEVCIVSNNRASRVEAFSQRTGVPAVAAAGKPRRRAFLSTMRRFNRRPDETVMIGDQLFTDVGGAKRCGIYTILVLPIDPREWWGTRITRRIERLAFRWLTRRGLAIPERSEGEGGKR